MRKQSILDVLESMPDDANVDELLNKLYVLEKYRSQRAIVAGTGRGVAGRH